MRARLGRGGLVAVFALVAFLVHAQARADTVTLWNTNAYNAAVASGQDLRLGVYHMAMAHGAMYDAVNAIDGGHEGYLLSSRRATPFDSKDAAAAAAAYRVLLNIVPGAAAGAATRSTRRRSRPSRTAPPKARGIAVGEAAAAAMIAARTDDGRFGTSGSRRDRGRASGGRRCRCSSTTRTRGSRTSSRF